MLTKAPAKVWLAIQKYSGHHGLFIQVHFGNNYTPQITALRNFYQQHVFFVQMLQAYDVFELSYYLTCSNPSQF